MLVVRVKLLRRPHDPLVLGVRLAHLHRDHNCLLHLGRDHLANFFVAPRSGCRRRRCCLLSRRHLRAPFAFAVLVFLAAFAGAFAFFGFAAFFTATGLAFFFGAAAFAAGASAFVTGASPFASFTSP